MKQQENESIWCVYWFTVNSAFKRQENPRLVYNLGTVYRHKLLVISGEKSDSFHTPPDGH